MPIIIRKMKQRDLQQFNIIISRAFTQARADCGYTHTFVPMCRREFINLYHAQQPEGAFIAEDAGQLRGGVFTHVWGKTGWIGPLAVAPEKHLTGIGKQLAATSIDYLKKAGCTTIGLETNPRNHRNLGFYGKLGFSPTVLSVDLIKPVSFIYTEPETLPHKTIYFSRLAQSDKQEFLSRVHTLAAASDKNIDYSSLIQNIDQHHYGETFLFIRKGTAIGFVIMQTEPTNTEEQSSLLRVFALVMHQQLPETFFKYIIFDLLKYSKKKNFERIVVRMPAYTNRVFNLFLENGFRVYSSDVRMTLQGYPEKKDSSIIHINRWV